MAGRSSSPRVGLLAAVCLALAACMPAGAPRGAAPSAADAAPPPAQGAADEPGGDFYRGKTIRIIVGADAGGGMDLYTRLIARHIARQIPGNPAVVVENMPGAGGLVAASHLYNTAPRDGTVLANIIGGIVRAQLFGTGSIQFDAARFRYLGAPNSESSVLIVTREAGITRLQELFGPNGKEVVLGDAGVATTNHNASILTREVLGANVKMVSGYSSVAKVSLAMEQGEVNGQYNDWASTKARDASHIESGDWLVIGQLTEQPLPDLPNVPLILDFARSDEQRQLLRYGIVVPNRFTRPYFLPPDVPADRAALLETAFARTMADPEFLADAAKSKLDIAPLSGAQLQQLIADYLAMPPELKSQLAKVLPQA